MPLRKCTLSPFCAAVLTACFWLAPASAQVAPQPGSRDIPRGYQAAIPSGGEESTHTPAFAYFVATVCTIVVMVIVCTPSRKLPA